MDPLVRDAVEGDTPRVGKVLRIDERAQAPHQVVEGSIEGLLHRRGEVLVRLAMRRPPFTERNALADHVRELEAPVNDAQELFDWMARPAVGRQPHDFARLEGVPEDLQGDGPVHHSQRAEASEPPSRGEVLRGGVLLEAFEPTPVGAVERDDLVLDWLGDDRGTLRVA